MINSIDIFFRFYALALAASLGWVGIGSQIPNTPAFDTIINALEYKRCFPAHVANPSAIAVGPRVFVTAAHNVDEDVEQNQSSTFWRNLEPVEACCTLHEEYNIDEPLSPDIAICRLQDNEGPNRSYEILDLSRVSKQSQLLLTGFCGTGACFGFSEILNFSNGEGCEYVIAVKEKTCGGDSGSPAYKLREGDGAGSSLSSEKCAGFCNASHFTRVVIGVNSQEYCTSSCRVKEDDEPCSLVSSVASVKSWIEDYSEGSVGNSPSSCKEHEEVQICGVNMTFQEALGMGCGTNPNAAFAAAAPPAP